MSGYQVLIEPPAWDVLMELPTRQAERVFAEIEKLEAEPRPSGVAKLKGKGEFYRVRSGDYRVVYEVQDDILIVLVVKVANRREVYKKRR